MNISKWLMTATLLGVAAAGSACAQEAADDTTSAPAVTADQPRADGDKALESTKDAGTAVVVETNEAAGEAADDTKNIAEKTGDKTKEIAGNTADKTKEIAGAVGSKTKDIVFGVGSKTKEVVSTTGEVITDGWITTKVSAKFVDEALLKDSNINVDTNDHVVTLRGPVTSDAAKARAAAIARDTEGVTRVVNELVVRART